MTPDDYARWREDWQGGSWPNEPAMSSEIDTAHLAWLTSHARRVGCAWCGEAIEPTDKLERAHIFPRPREGAKRKFVPRLGCAVVHVGCNRDDKLQPNGIVQWSSIVRPDWVLTEVPHDWDLRSWWRIVREDESRIQAHRRRVRGIA